MIYDSRTETPAIIWWAWWALIFSVFVWFVVVPFVRGFVNHIKKRREDERDIRAAIEKMAKEKGFDVRWEEFKWVRPRRVRDDR